MPLYGNKQQSYIFLKNRYQIIGLVFDIEVHQSQWHFQNDSVQFCTFYRWKIIGVTQRDFFIYMLVSLIGIFLTVKAFYAIMDMEIEYLFPLPFAN